MVIAKDYDNPIQILFSCRILALATFRIPSFGDIVMSALLDLQPPLHLSLPDIRFDVLNNVMSDDCFSCTLSESETVTVIVMVLQLWLSLRKWEFQQKWEFH